MFQVKTCLHLILEMPWLYYQQYFLGYILQSMVIIQKYSIEKSIMIQSITGTVLFWICTIFTHIVSKNEVVIRSLSRSEMLSILYLGLISTGLCLLMQTSFQRYTQATRASIFLASESLFAPIFAAIVLKEQLTVNIFIGAGLIIVAVLLSETKDLISLIFGKKKGIKK